jgi:hypothetical protein
VLSNRIANGEPPVDFADLRRFAPMPIEYAEDILDHLIAAKLVTETSQRARKFYQLREADMPLDDELIRRAVDVR